MVDILDDRPLKGRGTISNRVGRFEAHARMRTDDGWARAGHDGWDEEADLEVAAATQVRLDASRSVISYNDSPDVNFDRSINPYRGCEHGCVYCFARPSHAYLGHSPGLDFETILYAKRDAPALLAKELRARGYTPQPIALGANTDAYQPIERTERITRGVLEVLRDFRHPVGIITKSPLVLRDLDILAPMAADGLARVSVSITTLDRGLARKLEPRAGTPQRRLDAVRQLSQAGVPVSVLASPMIPALNDAELESILAAAKEAGATQGHYILLRLPRELADLMEEWLRLHAPDRADHVLSLIRQCRDGGRNHAEFGTRMRGTGPYAQLLAARYKLAVKRLGLDQRRWSMRCDLFRPPPQAGDQLALF
ncbi:PA0069 family radical SAM protein [Nitrospirillum sp. BR 11163]|uniref:PA0069 family radical SAM protein n=1 Tax=Nitrospirillum sp. BR 11163 TaxID=3104323 RepID=UPI002AFF030E|nr:PA0069 family radical SAM protein [Nitrospirillum sp. BR 11163]MEA1677091.1 PA0069 family radical SAM protein [Nitrospirillum sp. BR 11163]